MKKRNAQALGEECGSYVEQQTLVPVFYLKGEAVR
jgi:hypothetical protein